MRRRTARWLIAALLLANLLYYFWPRPQPLSDIPAVSPGVQRLELLEETVVADGGPAAPVAGVDTDVGQDPVAPRAVPEEPGPLAAEPVLSELALPARERLRAPRCFLAGPVESARLSEALTAAFDASGLSMDLVLQQVETEPDYWVYLDVAEAGGSRNQLSAQLRERRIDHFPIVDGELSGNLSLGLFRSAAGAQDLATRVREQGYPVAIHLRPRFREEAWIALTDRTLGLLEWPAEPGPVAGYPGLRLLERGCSPR